MDVHSSEARSKNMRAIRTKDTSPEVKVRKLLFAKGLRYRLHAKDLPGSPDIVFPKHNVVVFVHGCFWHKHNCHLFKMPSTRPEFWLTKIEKNVARDRRAMESLIDRGWRVLIVWECSIKGKHKWDERELQARLAAWIMDGSQKYSEFTGH